MQIYNDWNPSVAPIVWFMNEVRHLILVYWNNITSRLHAAERFALLRLAFVNNIDKVYFYASMIRFY